VSLEKFQEKNKRKSQIIIFTIVCIMLIAGVFLYQSYALFETKNNFNVISGSVENPGDLYFAYYINNEISLELPKQYSGYRLDDEKSNCTNNVSVTWDEKTWTAKIDYSNYKMNNKSKTRCNLYFKKKEEYSEPILNGMDPVLKDELIPVTIDANGTVHKADIKKEWYKYEEKKWANAIILKDKTKNYQNEEVIPEDEIESYFVWIPKYRYQLWNLEEHTELTEIDERKVHEIPVIFGDYNTSDLTEGECTTPMISGSIGNCEERDYMTHPAFLSIPSTGFWVGKFETSKGNDNPNNSKNPTGVQIKPNKVSWRDIQVGNAFYTSYEYKRNLDSHMMKNTEWGAVAYLQHSKYGSGTSVRFNNNSLFTTGYASVNEPTCGWTNSNIECNKYGTTEDITKPYNTETGVHASTTGNITGIYDMAGGAWEYVMGVMVDQNGKPLSGSNVTNNSGFNGVFGEGDYLTNGQELPAERYYDKYQYEANDIGYNKKILGDATGEMGPFESVTYESQTGIQISSWYMNHAHVIVPANPWIRRGESSYGGSEAGVFAFGISDGSSNPIWGFRIILTMD